MQSIKLIVVGEKHVGKTSIIDQYINNHFSEEYIMTMKISDRSIKDIELSNGSKIKLEIWDTIGQGQYRLMNNLFMKNTKIALLVYDITDQKSFDELNELYEQVNEVNGKGKVYFSVIGNKSDLYEKQVISKEIGEEYAKSINALFFETTATDHECIDNLFKLVVFEYVKSKIKSKKEQFDEIQFKNNKKINNKSHNDSLIDEDIIEKALKEVQEKNEKINSFNIKYQKKKKKNCC